MHVGLPIYIYTNPGAPHTANEPIYIYTNPGAPHTANELIILI